MRGRFVFARLDSGRIGDFGFVKHHGPNHTRDAMPDTGNRMSPMRVLLFEFRPQPADALCTGLCHPPEAGAEEAVPCFTLEL